MPSLWSLSSTPLPSALPLFVFIAFSFVGSVSFVHQGLWWKDKVILNGAALDCTVTEAIHCWGRVRERRLGERKIEIFFILNYWVQAKPYYVWINTFFFFKYYPCECVSTLGFSSVAQWCCFCIIFILRHVTLSFSRNSTRIMVLEWYPLIIQIKSICRHSAIFFSSYSSSFLSSTNKGSDKIAGCCSSKGLTPLESSYTLTSSPVKVYLRHRGQAALGRVFLDACHVWN